MPSVPSGSVRSRVLRVIDGDTVVLSELGVGAADRQTGGHRARLIGIDTPEVHGQSECFGAEASAFTGRELNGKDVLVDFDVQSTDRYGRALVYIWQTDGPFFNARLVAEGYAQQMTIPPNVRYAELFTSLVRDAREAGRGLWSACSAPAATPAQQPAPSPAEPASDVSVTFTYVSSPVRAGSKATASISTAPGAECRITVTYKSGPSKAQGLDPKTADGNGSASWTWTVGSNTTKGDWPIDVTCSHGGRQASQRAYFTVS